jgi:hypothetical protein
MFYALGKPQTNSLESKDLKIKIAPNEHYKAGILHKFFFGAHWRDLWTTPLEAELIDLDKFEGGIKPYKKGVGLQTKSLRFKGKDGREWKFIRCKALQVLPGDQRNHLLRCYGIKSALQIRR